MTTTLTPRTSIEHDAPPPVVSSRRTRAARLVRGTEHDPRWVRPTLVALLLLTAAAYVYDLSASGWANSFYAAAAQAGGESGKAWFFGSSDAANAITVDKPPAALWVMGLSVRIFGLSSWSLLVPEALMGVASVGLLYATVRRITGSPVAGLLAGLTLAVTPVAALMFRYDNPDALLVLLLVASTWATLRAIEVTRGRSRQAARRALGLLVLAGALVGLAFLTKMMQAFLVLPGLVLAYAIAADLPVWQRLRHLVAAFAAMVASAAWYVAVVELWPAASRPYIGGSQTNSFLELVLGYNGLGRLTGDETGSVGGGMWGSTGLWRLLDSDNGGQIGWLLPTAFLLLVAGVWACGRRPRTDLVRAGLVAFGGWLVVTAVTFSFMQGIFHAYYSVALAPAVAAVVGVGGYELWRRADSVIASMVLACAVALTAGVSYALLARTPDYLPWLRWCVLLGGLAAAAVVGLRAYVGPRTGLAALVATVVLGLAGPTAYTVSTVTTPHTGSIVAAGPANASSSAPGGQPPTGGTPPTGGNGAPPAPAGGRQTGTAPAQGQGAAMPTGGAGGLLDSSEPSARVQQKLLEDAGSYTWVAAAVGSQNASGNQLATERPVMAIGGFNGSDPSPTLAQFQQYVRQGRVHWFIASGDLGGSGSGSASAITTWVQHHFRSTTVGGVTLYDLSQEVSA